MACSGTGKGEIVRAIHEALYIRTGYKGLGQRGGGEYSESSGHLFKVAVSEIIENKKK